VNGLRLTANGLPLPDSEAVGRQPSAVVENVCRL